MPVSSGSATHALCWVHAERLVHKLVPATTGAREAVEVTRALNGARALDLFAHPASAGAMTVRAA